MPDAKVQRPPTLAVLLATYNGEKYLPELLDSVLPQLPPGGFILAHDDGSTDGTAEILNRCAAEFPTLKVLADGVKTGGASANFSYLLNKADADYIMLCDQDDIWLPGKIDTALAAMRELEARHTAAVPLLVHTDLKVTDEKLNVLCNSFMRYQNLTPDTANSLPKLVAQNVVTGCTTLINRALRDRALPVPPEAVMHDWWLALAACSFGHIGYDSTPHILYRQHGGNDTGAHRWSLRLIASKLLRRQTDSILATRKQAGIFAERYKAQLPAETHQWLETYAHIDRLGFFEKRIFLLRNGIVKNGLARTLGLLASI